MYRIGRPRLYAAVVITVLLECASLNLISIDALRPNLLLILVVFTGLHSDLTEALEAAVGGSLLRGAMTAGLAGNDLVILVICGLFAAYCKNKVYKDNFLTQIILTLFIGLVSNASGLFARLVVKNFEHSSIDLQQTLLINVVFVSCYTALFAPPAFFCLKKLLKVEEVKF